LGVTSGESLEEFEGSERESRGTVRCGMGETIDDVLATGGLPSEPVIGDVAFEQTLAVEVTEHPVANRVLELVPLRTRKGVGAWPGRRCIL
jgi:hypothetical protein